MQENLEHQQQGNKDSIDLAAENYLEFLKEGRSVILQDTAILQDQYPEHRLFRLPCFRLPAHPTQASTLQNVWAEYKAEVLAAHARSIQENLQVRRHPMTCLSTISLLACAAAFMLSCI